MHTVVNTEQMRKIDQYMIGQMHIPGIVLMENAAMGVSRAIMERSEPCVVHVFCGTGNNGGDGLAVARILLAHGYDVYVMVAGESVKMTKDAATNYAMFASMYERVQCFSDIADVYAWDVPQADVIVDALFGTGLTRDVEGLHRSLINYINKQGVFTVAVDIPSGIHGDTGAVMGAAVQADVTVTFQYPKQGHFLFPGRGHTGELCVVTIGVDEGCDIARESGVTAYVSNDPDISIPQRDSNANKGTYGKLLLVAGSYGMAGAAVLGARAASRAGAGLVTLASTDEVVQVVQQSVPEATCKALPSEEGQLDKKSVFEISRIAKDKTAIAAGPGLGTGLDIQDVVANVVKNYDVPKVIDADAINVLAGHLDVLQEHVGDVVLTPHPKEFAHLLGIDVAELLQDPMKHAREFAQKYGVVLLLKGATTIIAHPQGDVCMVCCGSPGMAKGGSGDVLTGLIGGFLAQGMGDYESALLGAYFAASAGEMAAREYGEYSMTPVDTIAYLGKAMMQSAVSREEAVFQVSMRSAREVARTARETEPVEFNFSTEPMRIILDSKPAEAPVPVPVTEAQIPVVEDVVEKSAEQAIAEIEAIENTQEIKKDLITSQIKTNPTNPPTRRRIG